MSSNHSHESDEPFAGHPNKPESKIHRLLCGCADPRWWELVMYALSTVSAVVAVALVYGAGAFRPYGSLVKVNGAINNGLSSILFVNIDKIVGQLPNSSVCSFDETNFSKVFSKNGESAATSALGFFLGVSAIFSFLLTLVYCLIFRSHFSFNRNGKKAKKKRFITVISLNIFILLSFLISGFVIFFGLESTLNNLDKDECFVACADCPQNFCVFQNSYAPSSRTRCPEGYSHKSTRSFADAFAALSAAQTCSFVGAGAMVICILLLFVGEPAVTYKACCKSDKPPTDDHDLEKQDEGSEKGSRRGSHKTDTPLEEDEDDEEDKNDVVASA